MASSGVWENVFLAITLTFDGVCRKPCQLDGQKIVILKKIYPVEEKTSYFMELYILLLSRYNFLFIVNVIHCTIMHLFAIVLSSVYLCTKF